MSEREWMALYEAEEALREANEALRLIAEEVRHAGGFRASDGYRSVMLIDRNALIDILDSIGINARNPMEQHEMEWAAEQWDKDHPRHLDENNIIG